MTRIGGPLPRWLWDGTPQRWILLRADGSLTYEPGPGDPPRPVDPMVPLVMRPGDWEVSPRPGVSPRLARIAEAILNTTPPPCPRCGAEDGAHLAHCQELP